MPAARYATLIISGTAMLFRRCHAVASYAADVSVCFRHAAVV